MTDRKIDRILTAQELAEKYKLRLSWVYSRTRETGPNSMPRLKCGKYLRFFESDVENWLKKQNEIAMGRS